MFVLKFFSYLPMWALFAFADLLFFITYYVAGYRKEVVLTNIKNAFPEKSKPEINRIAKEFYRRFCDYIVETLKALSISKESLNARVKFLNKEILEIYSQNNQPIILLGSHQFNWEWAFLAGCVELPFQVDAVYKRLSNRSFDKLMRNMRSRFGGEPIEKSQILRTILKTKDRLRALSIMADQSPQSGSPKYWTTMLHQDTAFFLGPEQIAKAVKYPIFFFNVRRLKRGHYTIEFIKMGGPPYEKDSHEILENYARALEKLIRLDPAGYMWSHRRWKLKKA